MHSPFIEFTVVTTDKPVKLNVLHIVAVQSAGESTSILTTPGIEYYVREPYAAVVAKMDEALDG